MAQKNCRLQTGVCSRELDGLVFTFLAILPGSFLLSPEVFTRIVNLDFRAALIAASRKDTPPPRFRFA